MLFFLFSLTALGSTLFGWVAQNSLLLIIAILTVGLVVSINLTKKWHIEAALVTSFLAFYVGLYSCLFFDKGATGFQFFNHFTLQPFYKVTLILGVDGISFTFLLLTLFIFPFCFLAARSIPKEGTKSFCNYLLSIEILLVLTFTITDLFYFYVFFESLLIPIFIIIGVWGARSRKIKAAYYFFLYTLFGSLIMLFGLIYLYFIIGSTNFFVIANGILEAEQQYLIWFCFFIAFAVKMPLFPFHIWLPEAHVEAPTVGSILLASLLLKLGGYGFLRFSLLILAQGSVYFAPVISITALLGVVYGSLSTIRQIDLKRIIAYSSVAHINLVMLGLFSFNQQGVEGAIFLIVGHGVVSTALFFCVGVLYDRHHSRQLKYYGGLVSVIPLFCSALFVFTLANISFPGTSNFLGELLVFLGLFAKNSTVLLPATSSIVLSAVYSVWLYNRLAFGTLKTRYIQRFSDLNLREAAILLALFIPMIVLGVSANFVLDFLHLPVKILILDSSYIDVPFVYENDSHDCNILAVFFIPLLGSFFIKPKPSGN